jgi:hypothetical protein
MSNDNQTNPIRRIAAELIKSESDYRKLLESGNSAAGGRVRKAALDAIRELKALRIDVQSMR